MIVGGRTRRVLGWAGVVLLGLVLGVGSAVAVLGGWLLPPSGQQVGAWTIDVDRGSRDAGPYLRATTAVQALLAMDRREAIYFVATEDDDGRLLDADCVYDLRGADQPAAWWSITLYDGAWLADNSDGHPSLDATSVQREAGPPWAGRLAATPGTGVNWISLRGAERPNLLLRLYVPSAEVLADPAIAPVPRITRVSCGSDR